MRCETSLRHLESRIIDPGLQPYCKFISRFARTPVSGESAKRESFSDPEEAALLSDKRCHAHTYRGQLHGTGVLFRRAGLNACIYYGKACGKGAQSSIGSAHLLQ